MGLEEVSVHPDSGRRSGKIGHKGAVTAGLSPLSGHLDTLANEFTEADTDLYYSSLFYLALILLVISFTVIALAKFWFLRNLQEQRI